MLKFKYVPNANLAPYLKRSYYMIFSEKRIFKTSLLLLAAVNLVTFAVYHLTTVIIGGTACAYIFFYFNETVDFILPLVAAAALFAGYEARGSAHALLRAVPYSLTAVLFKFPYHAFDYAYQGIEIDGVLLFSALNTILGVAVAYIQITVLYLLIRLVAERSRKSEAQPYSAPLFVITKPLGLDAPINKGILASAAATFIYKLVFEIIDTVKFLINYRLSYQLSEIAYMTFRYFFLLSLAFGAYILTVLVKNGLLKACRSEE